MLFSGTTKDFHKDFARLPELVRKRIADDWQRWRVLSAEAGRHSQKPADLEQRFEDHAKRMGLRETAINGIYRCDLGLGYRALGMKLKDETDKQRLIWFWAGSHADYDKLLKHGNDQKLIKTAVKARDTHAEQHAQWKQRRVRIKDPAKLVRQAAASQRPAIGGRAQQPAQRL